MPKTRYTMRDFLIDEMKRRDMSNRAFADFVGVSNATINRAVDARNPVQPSLEFLLKLSHATGKNLVALIEIAYPEVIEETRLSPVAQIFAQRFEELPDTQKDVVMTLLRNLTD